MRKLITARSLVMPSSAGPVLLDHPCILIKDDRIESVHRRHDSELPRHDQRDDYPDATLSPSFIDIHIHGAVNHDVMEATPDALASVGRFLASRGVGAFFPTTVTAAIEPTLRALSGLAAIISQPDHPGAMPVGIHLEGPFLSHAKRGVHSPDLLRKPSIELFTRFWEAAEGHIRLLTIAPEIEGAPELIEHATRLGVRVSLGHSNATTPEAERGIASGAVSATHTFNAMRALDHRDPGLLGTVLDTDTLFAELICDGVHVHPAMVRLFWKAKGRDRAILITDGISATGMPDGAYQLGTMTVTVKDGRCTHDGVLAGSVLTLDRAVANFRSFTAASLADTVTIASENPARLMGVAAAHGAIEAGRSADINVLTPTGEIAAVYLRGERIHS